MSPPKKGSRYHAHSRHVRTLGAALTRPLFRKILSTKLANKPKVGTKTKTMTKHKRARPLPNRGGTESSLNIYLKPKGLLNKIGGKMQSSSYTVNGSAVSTTTAGKQAVYNFPAVFSPANLLSINSNINSARYSSTGAKTIQTFMKSCFMEIMIQNSTNAVVRLQLWDMIARRDGYLDDASNPVTPSDLMSDGLKDQTYSGTGTEYIALGARLTDAVAVNQFFKVKRVTYTDLAPGQIHYHRIHYKINRRIGQELLLAANLSSIKGWTLFPTIVHYGEPVGDNSGGATVEATRLNCVYTLTYHYDWLENTSAVSSASNNVLGTTTGNLENLVTGASSAFSAIT